MGGTIGRFAGAVAELCEEGPHVARPHEPRVMSDSSEAALPHAAARATSRRTREAEFRGGRQSVGMGRIVAPLLQLRRAKWRFFLAGLA
jgi:hypothetical protein